MALPLLIRANQIHFRMPRRFDDLWRLPLIALIHFNPLFSKLIP